MDLSDICMLDIVSKLFSFPRLIFILSSRLTVSLLSTSHSQSRLTVLSPSHLLLEVELKLSSSSDLISASDFIGQDKKISVWEAPNFSH